MTKTTAFDYERQTWVTGEEATLLIRERCTRELEYLQAPTGEDYARFSRIANREQAIKRLQARLASLGKTAMQEEAEDFRERCAAGDQDAINQAEQ